MRKPVDKTIRFIEGALGPESVRRPMCGRKSVDAPQFRPELVKGRTLSESVSVVRARCLELFSSSRGASDAVKCGFFKEKPVGCPGSHLETALSSISKSNHNG